jgi:tetratricopeptide (TPR) repeat protein
VIGRAGRPLRGAAASGGLAAVTSAGVAGLLLMSPGGVLCRTWAAAAPRAVVADSTADTAAPALPSVDISTLPEGIRTEIEQARARVQASPVDAAALGDLGMLYLVYDFPGAAADCFKAAAAREPAGHRWAYYLGMAQHGAGDAAAAVAAFQRALDLRPDDPPTLVRLGGLLRETDSAKAAVLFERALRLQPGNARALAGLGHTARAAGNDEEALARFRAAVQVVPDYAEAHYATAMILLARGRREEARPHLQAHVAGGEPPLADDPLALELARKGRNAAALRREAAFMARRGDVEGAIALLKSAIPYDVSGITTRQHLGLLLAQHRRFAEAIDELSRVVSADPGNVEARSMLGLAMAEQGRLEEAEAQYREALRRHPDHAPTLIYLAQLLARTGRLQEAPDLARRGVEAQPANATYRLTLAELLARSGRMDEAIDQLHRVVQAAPAHAGARQMLGALLARAGDLPGASRQWSAAIEADPRLPEPHAGLAGAALSRGDAAAAVRWAEKACELSGYRVRRYLDTLAAAYEAAGRTQDAARARDMSAALPSDSPR